MKRLLLETSFSKIYMIVMIIISILLVGGYFSYAMFTVSKEKNNAISIVTGNLTYKLEVDGTEGNTLTVPANSSKEFIVTLTNPNNRVARFNFYYMGDLSNEIEAGYIEEDGYNITPLATGTNLEKEGTNGSSNIYKIMVTNMGKSEINIKLGVSVGLDYNDLELPDNTHVFDKYSISFLNKILVDNELQEEKQHMFNYTNYGMKYGESKVNQDYITNGLYSTEDEDGTSYYYRGEIDNNNVQFGEYDSDYYVYSYSIGYFQSLEACQEYNPNCSENNKVKLASKGDKMYWKIVRVNGDGSLRLIYNGTSINPSNTSFENTYLIGKTVYNMDATHQKYTGYTYDKDNIEKDSFIKRELETWYKNTLGNNSNYDLKIADGRFCNDTSGYKSGSDYGLTGREGDYFFSSMYRVVQRLYNFKVDINPTLICPDTSESFGGSYRLKVGLITADELVFAGESHSVKGYSYISPGDTGHGYWTITPVTLNSDGADCYEERTQYLFSSNINGLTGLRPVININAENRFTSGDGTASSPYVIK